MTTDYSERVIFGIIHDPTSTAPEFTWHLLQLAQQVTKLNVVSAFAPFARGTPEESLQQILEFMKQNPFNYAILMRDSVFPPVYAFRFFKNYAEIMGKPRPEALGGWTYGNSGIPRCPLGLTYSGEFSSKEGLCSKIPDFLVCTSDFIRRNFYNLDMISKSVVSYEGKLACDKYVGGKFLPDSKHVDEFIFAGEDTPFKFGGFRYLFNVVDPNRLKVDQEDLNECIRKIEETKGFRGKEDETS